LIDIAFALLRILKVSLMIYAEINPYQQDSKPAEPT